MIKELEKLGDGLNHREEVRECVRMVLPRPAVYDEIRFCDNLIEATAEIEKLVCNFLSLKQQYNGHINDELKVVANKQLNFLIDEINHIKSML